MIYAQFCRIVNGKLAEGCGDRAVFILDGRNKKETWLADARWFGKKHGWTHFQLCKGESFTRSVLLSNVTYKIDPISGD